MSRFSVGGAWSALASHRVLAVAVVILIALAARLPFLNGTTNDTDLYVVSWFDWVSKAGYPALGESVPNAKGSLDANYTPPYYYLLLLASAFSGVAPKLWLIKFISIAFDLLAGFFAFKIVRLHFSFERALLASLAVLLAPTMIANSGWWGQSDMLWVSFILGSLYFAMIRKPLAAVIAFGIGLSMKSHAFFFSPFLFMMFLRGEMRIWHFACIPLVYAAMMLPAVILGKTWLEVFTVYANQAGHFDSLSMNAPNLYYFLPYRPEIIYQIGVPVGLALTAIASAGLGYLPRLKNVTLDAKTLVLAATMFAALSVFLLPKMHDRYFLAADILSIVLVFFAPRMWLAAVGFQVSSMAAYLVNIMFSYNGNDAPVLLAMAILLNTIIVSFLVLEFWRACMRPGVVLGETARPFAIAAGAVVSAQVLWLIGAKMNDMALARFCPASGEAGAGAGICGFDMPATLVWGHWPHVLLFFAMLAACYAIIRAAAARIWIQR